jgi:Flp pilus assembly pilin Flp
MFHRVRAGEDGQTMAEYAVILGVLGLAISLAITALSGAIATALNNVTALL